MGFNPLLEITRRFFIIITHMYLFFNIFSNIFYYLFIIAIGTIVDNIFITLILFLIWEGIKFIHMRWFGFKNVSQCDETDFWVGHTYIIKLKGSKKIKFVQLYQTKQLRHLLNPNIFYTAYYFRELSQTNNNVYSLDEIEEAKPFDFTHDMNISYFSWDSETEYLLTRTGT